jgi:hypothetical protein
MRAPPDAPDTWAQPIADGLNIIIDGINGVFSLFGQPPAIVGEFTINESAKTASLPMTAQAGWSPSLIAGVIRSVVIALGILTFLKFEVDVIQPAISGQNPLAIAFLLGVGYLGYLYFRK